jgi:hypothetical protein
MSLTDPRFVRCRISKSAIPIVFFVIVGLSVFICGMGTRPKRVIPIDVGFGFSGLQLSHNNREAIQRELLDTNTLRLIAISGGLTDADLTTVQVAREPGEDWVSLSQLGKSEKAFVVLNDRLKIYVQGRQEGHTPAFLLAALAQRDPSTISDTALRAIATNRLPVPVSWLQRADYGTTTNKAGKIASQTTSWTVVNGRTVTNTITHIPKVDEICRWVSYLLVDGEVGWKYFVQFKADGSVEYVTDSRFDAKEYDAKYQKTIRDVEAEVRAGMKRDGSSGRFGSIHTFWHLKREKLKALGIEWRSPAELNPNTSYD